MSVAIGDGQNKRDNAESFRPAKVHTRFYPSKGFLLYPKKSALVVFVIPHFKLIG